MDRSYLETAMQAAEQAAEQAKHYKSETYSAVLLFELMKSSVPISRPRYELPTSVPSATPKNAKPYSAAELFAGKAWNTAIDKVLVAAFFLERYSATPNYTLDQIRNCLVAAKVALPQNINLAIIQAIQKGHLMEIPLQGATRKTWALTQSGENYVEAMAPPAKSAHA
jgi:hypothetical protein